MDIEDRAEKWVREYEYAGQDDDMVMYTREDMVNAYLAGSAQTQADYAKHFANYCERCECSCGAR